MMEDVRRQYHTSPSLEGILPTQLCCEGRCRQDVEAALRLWTWSFWHI